MENKRRRNRRLERTRRSPQTLGLSAPLMPRTQDCIQHIFTATVVTMVGFMSCILLLLASYWRDIRTLFRQLPPELRVLAILFLCSVFFFQPGESFTDCSTEF